ncbi:MAG: hypothetical protein Hyperionvirus11_1, partial [Hyperionvirus sp.]
YITNRPAIYNDHYTKLDDIYVELINNYNFYYLTKTTTKTEYLLITPAEFYNLFMFLNHNPHPNITLKHKHGNIKYPLVSDKPDPPDLLIKLVLSNRLTLIEYTQLFNQILADGRYDEFNRLTNTLTAIYAFPPANKRYIDYFLTQRERFTIALKELCDPLNIDKLLNILEIDLPSGTLTESEKQDIINNSGILSCPQAGGGKYRKYRFKHPIMHLRPLTDSINVIYRFKNLN